MAKKRRNRKKIAIKLPQIIMGCFCALLLVVAGVRLLGEQARVDVADQNANNQAEVQRNRQAFIKRLAPEAKRLQQTYHVLPSITLAQAILESDWGTSQLATNYHNLFGVKGTDPNQTKVMLTKEYRNGQWVEIRGRFQIYANDQASLAAHAALLANGTSWNTNQYQHVISATNYRTAAAALKQDGYATDPDYPAKLINLIKTYDLEQYDQ
ncbi:glycoside hydrolase family 73 protein [Loigolactobacillus backii]|uniref:N-acetylmuramidase n=1 Tax=Loigolactobacillus backii TaxID=375175 RepID=A0A192H5I4_9LACO|nr:glycoside hydrolase family 73 protein [Loigolactobacillus backii]ANK60124.1 N-acetylmuramidase [Loigolactobacillus backii]ANK63472.1 N-acetylmuramidase [Loigolactobacillus backii]ANK65006.1 N-acetylmuramidase [Loigolactobacillus backii]ANK66493.1 N-acetylmuramidase [Loigolactobacillus backii]ANK69524.1 N-acetylmuramidase [Loigolactobacillus backii]